MVGKHLKNLSLRGKIINEREKEKSRNYIKTEGRKRLLSDKDFWRGGLKV